jgi:hypothetical protein
MATAVDTDAFACDEIGFDQEQHGLRNLRRTAPSSKRRSIDHFIVLAPSFFKMKEDIFPAIDPGNPGFNFSLG